METGRLATRLREVRPPLSETLAVFDSVTSTNDVARGILEALPKDAALCDLLLVAREQTEGKGREGRSWWSPPGGGLFASLVVQLERSELLGALPLAVAVALCGTVHEAGDIDCGVKWPNDLVVGGRKLGGILIEMAGPVSDAPCAVVGFGINVDADREKLDEFGATSVALESGSSPELASLLIASVRALRRELAGIEDRASLVERYRDLIVHRRGDHLIWRQGDEIVEGYYQGIDPAGFLELETEAGLRVVNAGEIIAK